MIALRRLAGLAAALVAGFAVILGVRWGVEALWFRSVGFEPVFWRLLAIRVALFAGTFVVTGGYLALTLWLLGRALDASALARDFAGRPRTGQANAPATTAVTPLLAVAVALIPAFAFAVYAAGQWDLVIRFLWARPFGRVDPLFGRDIGFYLFTLPLLDAAQDLVAVLFLLATAAAVFARRYTLPGVPAVQGAPSPRTRAIGPVGAVLAVNAALFVAALGWGFYLRRYHLLSDPSGAVFGAGYVETHITRWALLALAILSAAVAAALPALARRSRSRLYAYLIGVYLALVFAGLVLLPAAVHRFVVEPNELALELPYLEHNIAMTRAAYGLDDIDRRDYSGGGTLALDALRADEDTVANIRIWDWRPLIQTFRQLQQIRTYYAFRDTDIDRYPLEGQVRQVMLAGRELDPDALPRGSASWVNRRLQYTHGYGLVMSLAAEKTEDGRPRFLVRDVPPQTPPDLAVRRPELYFGEEMEGYRIVNSGVAEFDYPKGDDNVYSHYRGAGGIALDAGWKRALLAAYLRDANVLISSYVNDASRLQMWRTVAERAGRIAPFLTLDDDPYLVVVEGRLYWIIDAYTTGTNYPYAEPYADDANYIRNAVKIVVDAYDGSVRFYVFAPDDPVLAVYQAAFPGMFVAASAMPAALYRHIRYPQDLFAIQVGKLALYHMTVPQVFYNREDVWTVPREKYGGEAIRMQPYYVLMRLPGEDRLEFLLMTPLSPRNRDNMIAWLAARSDPDGYGKLVLYKLPKEQLTLGPIQIEAMIDQDTVISQQLSLWDQRGSRVIRGNLLVIPIDDAFLYVEPVYLIAEDSEIPQLKRLIVSDGSRLAMEPTLEDALGAVFTGRGREERPAMVSAEPTGPLADVLGRARGTLAEAEQSLEAGDWAAFGSAMQRLKDLLRVERSAP
jgi:uncharacterized membrane protein (UPF0182 family)